MHSTIIPAQSAQVTRVPDQMEDAAEEARLVEEYAQAIAQFLRSQPGIVDVEDLGSGNFGAATREGAYLTLTCQPTSR